MKSNPSFYGFGGYRISSKSEIHKEALIYALENGISLIDTSSNYGNGESEELIGQVLKEHSQFNPFLITKAGYIQGQNLEELKKLNDKGLAKADLLEFSDGLKHSIHPEFLEHQIDQSLSRLKGAQVDCFLLHNPEYYFDLHTDEDEYYQRLEKAMVFLEESVKKGKIKSWGISSNNFVLSEDDKKVTNFLKVWQCYEKISGVHFKYIQFPFNMVEQGGRQNHLQGSSLIHWCKEKGMKTIANRPLNAFKDNELVRLAYYEVDEKLVDPYFQKSCWDQMFQGILKKWQERGGVEQELREMPLMSQVKEVWNELPSADAVNQVFLEHFFPLLTKIWGKSLDEKESEPYFGLYDLAMASALHTSNQKTRNWEDSADLNRPQDQKLQRFVCEKYKEFGIDHVLVGMRRKEYVEDFL